MTLVAQNRALHFNGQGEHVNISSGLNLGFSDFTVECWFRVAHFSEKEDGCLINKGLCSYGTPARAGFGLRLRRENGDNHLVFTIAGADGQQREVVGAMSHLSTDVWYHAAGVRQGTNLLLYLNGNCIAKTDFRTSLLNVDTNLPLSLGACRRTPIHTKVSNYLEGDLDEVRIWNVARSPKDLVLNSTKEITGKEKGLLVYFNFNSTNQNSYSTREKTLFDKSTGCHHGQLVGYRMNGGKNSGWINRD
jgi:hypothetical protein